MITWDPESDASLLLLFRSGVHYRRMADALLVSTTAVRNRLMELDVFEERKRGRPRVQWTVPMDKTLIAMREQKRGYKAVAAAIGVTPATAEARIKELGLPVWDRRGGYRKRLTEIAANEVSQ